MSLIALGAMTRWEARNVMDRKETYLESVCYDRFIKDVVALFRSPCLFTGVVTADQAKILVGERLNIWPASIAPN
jgi:hypothetical protein